MPSPRDTCPHDADWYARVAGLLPPHAGFARLVSASVALMQRSWQRDHGGGGGAAAAADDAALEWERIKAECEEEEQQVR